MAEIPYVCLYRSYYEELENFSQEQRGLLLWALLEYLYTGQEPELPEPERYFWPRLRTQHLRDAAHYEETCERNRINGEKGGRPKVKRIRTKPTGFISDDYETEKPTGFISDDCETEKPTGFLDDSSSLPKPVAPKEREKEKEKEREKEKHTITEDVCVSFPSKEDVSCFCTEQGLQYVDAERFVTYYDSVGWVINGQAIRDWKAAAKLWNHRERCKAENKRGTHGFIDDQLAGKYGTVV